MGQRNNSGRNASLDEHKERAAGRRNTLDRQSKRGDGFDAGKTSGAFGREGVANRRKSARGHTSAMRDRVGRSTQRTRKG